MLGLVVESAAEFVAALVVLTLRILGLDDRLLAGGKARRRLLLLC